MRFGLPIPSAKMKVVAAGSLLILLLTQTACSNESLSYSAIANFSTFCVDLPIHDANRTFCGISTKWKPRINKTGGIFACVIPTLMSWTFTFLVVIKLRKKIEQSFEDMPIIRVCYGYVLFYGKLLWDAVDVTLDSYLFYQLELGQVIDENITRNTHVNNSILAFAIIGSAKVLFFLLFGINDQERDQEHLEISKLNQMWYVFLFEDGPELILEYFYVEKYVSSRPPWYLFVRDILLAFISLHIACNVLKWLFCEARDVTVPTDVPGKPSIALEFPKLFTFFSSLIGVLMFLRVGGAGYQYVTGRLTRGCFHVQDGMLLQNPFSEGCLREVDYLIIILSCLLLIPSIFIGCGGFCFASYHAVCSCCCSCCSCCFSVRHR